jgi:hypothetical protein
MPEVPRKAYEIFNFIHKNSNLVTITGGMDSIPTGIARDRLAVVAQYRGIDMFSIEPYIDMYESAMLKANRISREAKKK